jgi:hypothetical protein
MEQVGFRKGFSTVDNIFVLYSLITIYFSQGKKLYCTFVDFKCAVDTVWRSGLWQKLQKSNIKGKIFTVIYILSRLKIKKRKRGINFPLDSIQSVI